jgi:hypothetical protein
MFIHLISNHANNVIDQHIDSRTRMSTLNEPDDIAHSLYFTRIPTDDEFEDEDRSGKACIDFITCINVFSYYMEYAATTKLGFKILQIADDISPYIEEHTVNGEYILKGTVEAPMVLDAVYYREIGQDEYVTEMNRILRKYFNGISIGEDLLREVANNRAETICGDWDGFLTHLRQYGIYGHTDDGLGDIEAGLGDLAPPDTDEDDGPRYDIYKSYRTYYLTK